MSIPIVVNMMQVVMSKSKARWAKMDKHLYIGRRNRHLGLEESKWANPYSLTYNSRERCLALYKEYIVNKITSDPIKYDLLEFAGKELGCTCAPFPCHGDVLRQLYMERFQTNVTECHQEISDSDTNESQISADEPHPVEPEAAQCESKSEQIQKECNNSELVGTQDSGTETKGECEHTPQNDATESQDEIPTRTLGVVNGLEVQDEQIVIPEQYDLTEEDNRRWEAGWCPDYGCDSDHHDSSETAKRHRDTETDLMSLAAGQDDGINLQEITEKFLRGGSTEAILEALSQVEFVESMRKNVKPQGFHEANSGDVPGHDRRL